jgi:hypothetical protein
LTGWLLAVFLDRTAHLLIYPSTHLLIYHLATLTSLVLTGAIQLRLGWWVECVCLLNPSVATLGLCLWLNSWTKVRVGYTVRILIITIRRMRNEQT